MVDYDLDLLFHAMASPVRRAIVARLAGGEVALGVLAEPFEMTLQGLSKHVTVLQGAGVVLVEKRHRSHFVRLEAGALDVAGAWLAQHHPGAEKEPEVPHGRRN
jgi:DNA-binding transcriptional ArsR family regulator